MTEAGEHPLRTTEGFARLYGRESLALTRFFARRVFDAEVALDLTAETFAQAFLSRRKFKGSTEGEAVAWLHGIARRQLARFYRKGAAEKRALQRLGLEPPAPGPEDLALIEELAGTEALRTSINDGLRQLSDDHREALRLRVVEERTYEEIANRIGVSEQTARARVSRGLRALERAVSKPKKESPA